MLAAFAVLSGTPAYSGSALSLEKDSPALTPMDDQWHFTLSLPAWILNQRGDSGLNGSTSHSVTGFNELVNKIDLAAGFRAEAMKGRFGVRVDFSYTSISESKGVGGVVRKVDVQLDEILGDLGVSWRLIQGTKGYLDVIGGVRYTNLYDQIKVQGNDEAISAAANRLAVAGTSLRAKLGVELAKLRAREGGQFTRPSLTAAEILRLSRELREVQGNAAERTARIDKTLRRTLNSRVNREDYWFDPYIGLRWRYNFSDKFYFVARADISPFDVGADFAWQASAGFGVQLARNVTYEIVYRALDVDYRHDGLIYDTTSYCPEATIGISF
jgi:opacity protein-like surface antigen